MNKTPLHTLLTTAINNALKGVYTSQVGHIVAFNPTNQRAQVQIGVQRINLDGTMHNPPVIDDVPVLFLGGVAHVEFEVNPNDEGLLIFPQRNIDGWKQTGGIAANPTPRIMQMQDCVFIHGIRSLTQVIQGFANDGIRLRHGENYVWIKRDGTIESKNDKASVMISPDGDITLKNEQATHTVGIDGSISSTNNGGFIKLLPDGTAQINGLTIPPAGKGEADYDGTIKAKNVEATEDVKAGNTSLNSHVHGGVMAGGDVTGGPQ